MARLIEELKRRKVIRVLVAYLIAAWVLLQIAEVLSSILSLPDWAPKLVLFLLAIGLIPALILAWAYELTPDGIRRDAEVNDEPKPSRQSRPNFTLVSVAALLAAGLGAGVFWMSGADARWARDVALPQIEKQLAADDWEQANYTALEIRQRMPDSAILDGYWSQFAIKTSIPSEPAGATVYRRAYDNAAAPWQRLGETPLYDIPLPRGYSLIRIELEGFDDVLRTVGGMRIAGGAISMNEQEDETGIEYFVSPIDIVLEPSQEGENPEVRVPGTRLMLDGQLVRLSDFRIGRYEVTNRQFREFVTAGGYRQRDLWEHEFVRDGQTITWDEAMASFIDSTGRPGPSSWIGGTFPEGKENYPVGGVSWYEAAAYARFSGRELPTVHHWRRAHAPAGVTWQIPASNVELPGGLAAVGQFEGPGWTGTSDMLGNVREWCLNAFGEDRAILGGAWNDVAYLIPETIDDPAARPPFDRSRENGMRLASLHDERAERDLLRKPLKPWAATPLIEPASDEVFAAMLRNYEDSSAPLNARIDETVNIRNRNRQRISFDRGDGERIELLLYLPDSDASRHPAMIFWPSSLAIVLTSLDNYRMHLDFMLNSGWAVALPIFEGTFHRGNGQYTSTTTIAGRDLTIRQVREFRRAIDYLETRPDMDTEALAFCGFSWGGVAGPIALAVESRIKVAILNQAGIFAGRNYDIDLAHYLPRVHQPVLQFNGRFDTNFRYEESAKPFFDRLGSESKKHVVEPTGHFISNSVAIGETLAWLDEHLDELN